MPPAQSLAARYQSTLLVSDPVADAGPEPSSPGLPPGRRVELPAGTVVLRELAGPPGAPALVLLHGWTATADLNFFRVYGPLSEHFRVLAFDHRGHGTGSGRGHRSGSRTAPTT